MQESLSPQSLLLIDTCGERGSLALFRDDLLVAEVFLPERTASAGVLGAVRDLLGAGGLSLAELSGVGVVNGPGSFTGLRVGLAVVKGLCESARLRVGSASRLAVLWEAGQLRDAYAVLRAGRDEVYVREIGSSETAYEYMVDIGSLAERIRNRPVLYAEGVLEPVFAEFAAAVRVDLSARHAHALIKMCLKRGGDALASLDANYVRDERSIYRRGPGKA